jgi:hypothetical protein
VAHQIPNGADPKNGRENLGGTVANNGRNLALECGHASILPRNVVYLAYLRMRVASSGAKLASSPAYGVPLRPVPIGTSSTEQIKGVPLWHQHAISVAKAQALETMFLTHRSRPVVVGIQTSSAYAPLLVELQSVKTFVLHALRLEKLHVNLKFSY